MRPTFIACTARSGSTLLRWLLDSHPEISCPAESDVALALGALVNSVGAMASPSSTRAAEIVRSRRAIDEVIDAHLREHGARHFVDKSLSNALHLDQLAEGWPMARFIFLHRHVMDFIASALAAQPFGLTSFGFDAYAARYPGNDVRALAHYWLERTGRMLDFERKTGHRTVRVHYEDLVTDTMGTLARIWPLIRVEPPENDPADSLSRPRDDGRADHRIWYTDHVTDASLGAGARIPPGPINGLLRRDVNDALGALGYPLIDDAWGAGGPLVDGEVRWVLRHDVIGRHQLGTPGTIVLEHGSWQPDNVGDALRSRDVRYYGSPLSGYREEREVMRRVMDLMPKVV